MPRLSFQVRLKWEYVPTGVIHELREFCEDNNVVPPAPLKAVRARGELTFWSAGDPALEIEAMDAVEMRSESGRALYLQRVVYELRYLLLLENGVEFERGHCPDLTVALAIARIWLAGGALEDLPKNRRFWI